MRLFASIGIFLASACACSAAATHPTLFVTPADRDAVLAKIEHADWAHKAYGTLKSEVDRYVDHCQADSQYMTSRLLLNWQTHYELPIVKNDRWIGGDGTAPIPTVRFAGARDWATKYHAPTDIEDFRPFNDDHGKIWLINSDTNHAEWVDPGITGRTIEVANARILQLAANAAFVYWLTGDEKYARFASDILWTYMQGFSYVQLPRDESGRGPNKIIGMTSFEVIHEDSMLPLGEAYDFLHDYLIKQGRDVGLIQAQLKRVADRVIDGGSAVGNWNLNEAKEIAPATLALDENAKFPDHHGREYYVDILLNARLPAQTGIVHVIQEGYDPTTMLWPEAPGYGFGTTPQVIQIASMLENDPAGKAVLNSPVLPRALLAQSELLYPNGWSIGLGDTDNTRISATALELLIAAARKQSDDKLESRLTPILEAEIEAGFYDRSAQANIPAITQYVAVLKEISAFSPSPGTPGESRGEGQPRTYFGVPLNVLMQRNDSDRDHSLAAAMYGTEGGHVHANGLAIELYGAGLILGADPGRGASYWTADHHDYYSQPPAHNTVIVNGKSNYPAYGNGRESMKIDFVEPAVGDPGICPDISFAQSSFAYATPAVAQQRTLALVRTGPQTGFYFDVFRSRADSSGQVFHDYLYHNIGQSLTLLDAAGGALSPMDSHLLGSENGDMRGYDYFKNEKSLDFSGDLHAIFNTRMPDGSQHLMAAWFPGHQDRRIFSLSAPADHAAREELPKEFNTLPMPTLLVRQTGDAWVSPFIAIFEPYLGTDSPSIVSVRSMSDGSSLAACVVQGRDFDAVLLQDPAPSGPHIAKNLHFDGSFAIIIHRAGNLSEAYISHGKMLQNDEFSISSDEPTNAVLMHSPAGWKYSATHAIKVHLVSPATHLVIFDGLLPPGADQPLKQP